MKKILLLILALFLCFSFCACGKSLEDDLREAQKRTEMFQKDLNDINKNISETNRYFK